MNINKNNYEPFFIDYYDGNLSPEQVSSLFLFLESHPELKSEFESFSNITLDPPTLQFPDRDSLKRGVITASNIDQYLVASIEGDLSLDEEKELKTFLQKNTQYHKDAELYKKTISAPDYSIVYPDKKSLRQPVPFYVAYRNEIRMGIAAILLLSIIAGSVAVFNRTLMKTEKQVAGQLPIPAPTQNNKVNSTQPQNAIQPSIKNSTIEGQPQLSERKTNPQPIKNQKQVQPENLNVSSPTVEPLLMANALPVTELNSQEEAMQLEIHPANTLAQTATPSSNEQYVTVWEALRQSSEKNLRKALGKDEEVLAYANEDENSKVRLIDVVSKGVEKISNDKAKLESTYDNDKQSNAFSFSIGKFSIEKK